MTIRSRKFSKTTNRATLDQRIDQAIIWITVLALVALPLFFSFFHFVSVFNEPKVVMLHLTAGLIAILWLWQIVLNRINDRSANDDGLNWDLLEWTGRNPARWALVGIAVWVFAQLASTILSPLPIISFFGGDEARSGYNLYDNLSLIVILLSVAVRFRTFKTLQILAYTLVITGTIAAAYGIAQHFGWDPIGNNGGRTRVIASFGNTLNFGGYMVMSIPATLAFTYKKFDRNRTALVIFTLALALQVSGIWFTGSRGPWVGCTASIISFFAITAVLGNKKESLKGLGILAAASVIAAIVAVIPTEQDDIGLSRLISIGNQFSSETSSTDIGGGLSGRFNIWESTLKMATQWELPVEEPTANKLLRPLFGVGQDIYVYAFPLVGKPQSNLSLVDHAHNYELQILAEQGFVGFLAFVSSAILLCLAVLVMVRRMRRSGNGIDTAGFLVIALSPAMIGKLVEMQSGVARISDLAMNMALLGSGIAIYEVVNRHLSSAQIDHHKTAARKPSSVNFSASNQMVITSTIVAAVLVTAVFISIFVSWDLRRLSASRTLATGYDAQTVEERARIWGKVQAKAPERESFTFTLFEKYWIAAKQQHELGNKEEALRLLNIGRDMLLAYEEHDPLELDTQTGLMKAATTMAVWGYSEFQQELADRAIKLAEANPAYPTIIGTSATALTSVGLHKLAIEYADQAIATEATTRPWSKAWYAKGRALYELGREDEAIEVLITATEKEPGAEGAILSHQILSQIYKAQGDDDRYNLHAELGQVDITVQE